MDPAALELELERAIGAPFLEDLEDEIIGTLTAEIRRGMKPPRHAPFPDRVGYARWREDYDSLRWMREVRHPNVRVEGTPQAKQFRQRFRVPYVIFEDIVEKMRQSHEFDAKGPTGGPPVPLELKLMSLLRYYATGAPWSLISECAGFSQRTMVQFEAQFLDWFVRTRFARDVCPSDPVETERRYARGGFPGCVGSMDGVHVAWDRCPFGQVQSFKGKEGYPTVAFNVIVDSNARCQSISPAFPGCKNDKTLVRADAFVNGLKSDPRYRDAEFQVRCTPGDPSIVTTLRGFYVMCDGGYHQWPETISGAKSTSDRKLAKFSAWLESQRKDVECFFGRLKKRFRILRIPMLFDSLTHIENVFKFCAALHNMLLSYDGLDGIGADEDHWIERDLHEFLQRVEGKIAFHNQAFAAAGDAGDADFTFYSSRRGMVEQVVAEKNPDFIKLRRQLMEHVVNMEGKLPKRKTAEELRLGARYS